MQSKISVIIPTFRRADFLVRAVESALSQTYSLLEILIVDNNDNLNEHYLIKEKLKEKLCDKRVNLLICDIKKNGSAARNFGIKNATGEYIAFLDDDDFFHPLKLEKQLRFLEVNEEYDAVCCEFQKLYKNIVYKINHIKTRSDGNYLVDMLSGNTVLGAGSSILIKKSIVEELNGFDISFQRHQDYEFLLRFFRKYRLGIVNEVLLDLHSDGIRNFPSAEKFSEIKNHFFYIFENDLKKLSISDQFHIYDNHQKEVALYYYIDSNYEMAKYHLKQLKDKKCISFSYKTRLLVTRFEKKLPCITHIKFYIAALFIFLKFKK